MNAQRFPLQPRWGALIGGLLLFGGGAVFLGARASGNERRLIINGIIELDVASATKFYWVMAALSLALAAMAVVATIRVLGGSQVVTVEDDAVTIPGALFQAARRVPYRDITKLTIQTVAGQELLRVEYPGGSAAIVAGQVGELAFRELVRMIEGRFKRSHDPG